MGVQKRYRPNVAAVILSPQYPQKCEIFIARRIDIKNAWQFPQGGIDEGETPQEALLRELTEEIGTDEVEIIAEHPKWLKYDFPTKHPKGKCYNFDGQAQKYFLVRLKDESSIKLDSFEEPEFSEYCFVDYENVLTKATHFKRRVYKMVLDHFAQEGHLNTAQKEDKC